MDEVTAWKSDSFGREQFWDEYFQFMEDNGTPVSNYIHINSSYFDLFEFYKLVVERGGFYEVGKKRLWQQIKKGLKLPKDFLKNCFELNSKYVVYLYAFECAQKGFSTPDQVQQILDKFKKEQKQNTIYESYSNEEIVKMLQTIRLRFATKPPPSTPPPSMSIASISPPSMSASMSPSSIAVNKIHPSTLEDRYENSSAFSNVRCLRAKQRKRKKA